MHQLKQRNTAVELLRLLFMYMIVVGHVYVHGSGMDYSLIYSWGANISTACHLSMFALSKLGVTGFMFISGYYGIRMSRAKWVNLLLICLFYYVLLNHGNGLKDVIHAYDSWWYISSYLIICILAPFIEEGIKSMGERSVRYVVLGLLFYNYVGRWIAGENSHDTIMLLSIYITARYLKEFAPPIHSHVIKMAIVCINRHIGLTTFLVCLWIAVLPVFEVYVGLSDHHISRIISNNNIILLIFSALLLKNAEKYRSYNYPINWLASSVLAIYLITDYPTVRDAICPWLFPYMMNGTGYVFILGICLTCLIIDKIRGLLFKIVSIFFYERRQTFSNHS